MTDREKLGKLLAESASISAYKRGGEWEYSLNFEEIIDHLIANGVTAKEMKNPLTVGELFEIAHKCDEGDRTVWMEDATGWADGVVLHVCSVLYDSDEEAFVHYMLGDSDDFYTDSAYYGKTWRCWAEKPTEAERKNAKWEE